MNQTAQASLTVEAVKGKLLAAFEYLTERQDGENAGKVKQLAAKLVQNEFAIAFCGHFSAGKSKMINCLVGENLLPSSPIPTSANLVKVRAGETEYAKVVFKNEKPRLYLAPYDYELVKQYCKDGDQIQEIEISHADSQLPRHTVVMDTPGIDSADDAHRIATESAIHLADLIFYVMDYNHVQSELNFMFTRELTEAGKEVYLVINQIDKHSQQELSFAAFQNSVSEAFDAWGVKPAAIFYTSLKQENHAENQFPALQAFLAERLQDKDTLLLASIVHSLQKILKDHVALVQKRQDEELQSSQATLNELSPEARAELTVTYQQLMSEKEQLGASVESADSQFEAEVAKIMASTYLMPFQTRALAEAYLEACRPEFKVGLLFRKQKTLAEREKRLDLFYQDILEKTKSQVEWHLRNFLLAFLQEKRLEHSELQAKAQAFQVQFSADLLASFVKEGARMSGDYVLNYSDDVANEIKRIAKRHLTELKEEILQALAAKNTAIDARISAKLGGLEQYVAALAQVTGAAATLRELETKLAALLTNAAPVTAVELPLFQVVEPELEIVEGATGRVKPAEKDVNRPVAPLRPAAASAAVTPLEADKLKHTARKLATTAQLVQGLPGFAKLAGELQDKAQRLAQRGFTVALFGAFSAGKSSFANALIGGSVLPVSPNPMTAAINRIKPVDAAHSHGTVIVKLKAEAAMLEDVNHALKLFALRAANLNEALTLVNRINGQTQEGALEKTNYTFLQAFCRGYAAFGGQLGALLTTSVAEFSDYVANEEKSCFVEWIDLYYDCPLTQKGITLVDTPGADSINARHTGVAFDFIKNSDAILFVTYYNHAFSKADREFLIQLGRVKDSFQLDKMFFLINAIDLADDEEEKEAVMAYVHEHLLKYGVRNPHLYALSSLQALQEKQGQRSGTQSGLSEFETAFYHFITHDLANMAAAASENELQRVGRLVEKLIASSREDATVKAQKRARIEAEKTDIHRILGQQQVVNLKARLQQETEELIYYIKQRVFLRFSDFFRESFNPAVLRDDGRNLKKALQQSLDELVETLGFELAQELRATTVRLDRFAATVTTEYQAALLAAMRDTYPDVSFSLFEWEEQTELEFVPAFTELQAGIFSKALSYFKNPKAFFEKNESKLMSDELQRVLSAKADDYLQPEQARLQDCYGSAMEHAFAKLIAHMNEQADDFYLSLLSALDGGVPEAELLAIRQQLQEVV